MAKREVFVEVLHRDQLLPSLQDLLLMELVVVVVSGALLLLVPSGQGTAELLMGLVVVVANHAVQLEPAGIHRVQAHQVVQGM